MPSEVFDYQMHFYSFINSTSHTKIEPLKTDYSVYHEVLQFILPLGVTLYQPAPM